MKNCRVHPLTSGRVILLTCLYLMSACSGGGDGGEPSTIPTSSSASYISHISVTEINPRIMRYDFIEAGKGFALPAGSTFQRIFRLPLITDGSSNPRSISFVARNETNELTCVTSITLPDGRIIQIDQNQISEVLWPTKTTPEYSVLANCQGGGSVVMLTPVHGSLGNPGPTNCKNTVLSGGRRGFYTASAGCVHQFPSLGDPTNQDNLETKGHYLFQIGNAAPAETITVPYVIVNERPYSYPEDGDALPGNLNVSLVFCGISQLNDIPQFRTIPNALLFDFYGNVPIDSGFVKIRKVGWPTRTGGSIFYNTCHGNDNVIYGSLDNEEEFNELVSKYDSSTPGTVNVFVVNDIRYDPTIAGLSPVPGMPYTYGTTASGLVVQSPNDNLSQATVAEWLIWGGTLRHEIGHFLGLRHTTEIGGSPDGVAGTDYLTQTPYCSVTVWSANEDNCPDRQNIMFPIASTSSATGPFFGVTADQRSIIQWNPLVIN